MVSGDLSKFEFWILDLGSRMDGAQELLDWLNGNIFWGVSMITLLEGHEVCQQCRVGSQQGLF